MSDQIMVSVAIPTYNQEKYIAETINSALAQKTDFQFEIVVGEDCSHDATRAIVEDIERQYPGKVRAIINERNLGLMLNVKRIFDNCRGKYIALLGGDDLFISELKLQKQCDFLERNLNYGLIHSDAKILYERQYFTPILADSADLAWKRSVKVGDVCQDLILENFIIASTVMFRKTIYDRYVDFKYYHDLGVIGEDRPLFLELSLRSRCGYAKEALTQYRVLAGTISKPKDINKYYMFYESSFLCRKIFVQKYFSDNEELQNKLLEKFNLFKLDWGFELRKKDLAEEAYFYLKNNGRDSAIAAIYYAGSRVFALWLLTKVLKKIFKVFQLKYL